MVVKQLLQGSRALLLALVVHTATIACTPMRSQLMSPCNGTSLLQQGFTDPLIGAAGSGDLEAVQNLIASGHDVNFQECDDVTTRTGVIAHRGWTPLIIAAGHGHNDVVRVLVEAGARLDAQTSNGTTALSLALRSEQSETAELLRTLGAKE